MKYVLHVILLLFLLIGCGSNKIKKEVKDGVLIIENPEHGLWQKESIPPISFELEKTYGKENEPEEEVLASIGSVFTDNNRNVFIFDWRENRLVAFDFDGNFLWSKGRRGQGPGEFNHVRGVVFDGQKYIYVSNISGTRIDCFDLNGDYQNSYLLSNLKIDQVSLEGFIKPNILVATQSKTGEMGVHIILLELDESIKIKTQIDPASMEIFGSQVVEGVKILENGEEKQLTANAIFIELKDSPDLSFFSNIKINTDENGFIIVDTQNSTNIEGIFAAGTVTGELDYIPISMGHGYKAGISASRYLEKMKSS